MVSELLVAVLLDLIGICINVEMCRLLNQSASVNLFSYLYPTQQYVMK